VELDQREGEPTALLATFENADAVWLVDAVSSGGPPGTVHRLDATRRELPTDVFSTSTHHVGLAEAVELARALDQLPRSTIVYGIEGSSFAVGDRLSSTVAAVVDSVADAIREEVRAFTSGR
jgi:hydrogenase maturation protease